MSISCLMPAVVGKEKRDDDEMGEKRKKKEKGKRKNSRSECIRGGTYLSKTQAIPQPC